MDTTITDNTEEQNTNEGKAQEQETPAELMAQLEEQRKSIAALKRESMERRIKLEGFEKIEAERKTAELSEIEKADAKVKAIEALKAELEAENKTLKLQGAFNSKVIALKLEFMNELAAEDAYKNLNVEDVSGMEDAVKLLLKDRPYLFKVAEQGQQLNDGARKTKQNSQEQINAEALAQKRRNYQSI